MSKPLKVPPPYAIASVDHALRAAVILQLEGSLTVSEMAERLGVARSTAHRVLGMLVYRDFATQDDRRRYRAGPVLELASHAQSDVSSLRTASLVHLHRLVELLDETANLTIRTGDTVRFIASVECGHALRVGSREGMVFPAHRTTAGLLLLAELDDAELARVYARGPNGPPEDEDPDLVTLSRELKRIRRSGFAVNRERSEHGLVAVGVPVRGRDGAVRAGLSVAMPKVRYDPRQLQGTVAGLRSVADALEADLARLR